MKVLMEKRWNKNYFSEEIIALLEVYNRYFWSGTLMLLVTFKWIKKPACKTLKFLPIPQTFPMTAFILKIIMLKKDTYKPQISLWFPYIKKLKKDTYKPQIFL